MCGPAGEPEGLAPPFPPAAALAAAALGETGAAETPPPNAGIALAAARGLVLSCPPGAPADCPTGPEPPAGGLMGPVPRLPGCPTGDAPAAGGPLPCMPRPTGKTGAVA